MVNPFINKGENSMDIPGKDNDFANKGQAFADKAADKIQSGIHDAKQGANLAASSASNKVESLRNGAGSTLNKASDQAQGMMDTVSDAAQKAKDFAADTQDSIVAYTREQPVKALLIAAAAGAALITLIRAFSSSND
ncbi:MAG: hypothetical protein M3O26_14900 [Pseudomonadota bacterium]|nr:hypothetical protein [Pseudomonadota bacterium]